MKQKIRELQRFVSLSLQNADGLRFPYNLDKILKMVKEIANDKEETKNA